jgi:hypothetical protein
VNPIPGLDYAWNRPTTDTLKKAGAQWIGRYLSADPTKNLTAPEYLRLTAAGLPVVVVWETTANRAGAGYTAGVNDAKAALALADSIGLGPDSVIHFAVDYDATWSEVMGYFSGASHVLGSPRTGVYGGVNIITAAANAGYTHLWQTTAWSGGRWDPRATIRQTGNGPIPDTDLDQAMTPDYGQHPRPAGDTVTPQDKQDIIDGVVAGITAVGPRNALATADLWWLQHALDGTTTPGMTPAQTALIEAIHSSVIRLGNKPA